MPTYVVTGPDGNKYKVNTPEGATEQQAVAYVADNYYNAGQEKNTLERVPLVGGALASAADLPLSFGEALAGVGKTFTDVFGANNRASQFLGDVAKGAADWKSSGSKATAALSAQDMAQAEKQGKIAELGAALRQFGRAPLETTASLAGSAVPFIAATLAAPETGGASLAPVLIGMGAVSGAGMIKGDIYDAMYQATYEQGIKQGLPEVQAKARAEKAADTAQAYGGKNTDMVALGTALGAVASATGFTRQVASTIGKRAAARVAENAVERTVAQQAAQQGERSLLKGAALGSLEEAIPEGLQAAHERYSQNLAQNREGMNVDPWAGVVGQGAFEGIASLIPGGYGGFRETSFENRLHAGKAEEEAKKVMDAERAAMPANPSPEYLNEATQRWIDRGFNEETARALVMRDAEAKRAAAGQGTDQAENGEALVRPSVQDDAVPPDVGAPPPVDAEEQAAMQQAYEQEYGAPVQSPRMPSAPQDTQAEEYRPPADIHTALDDYMAYTVRGQRAPDALVRDVAQRVIDIQQTEGAEGIDALDAERQDAGAAQFVANEGPVIGELLNERVKGSAPETAKAPAGSFAEQREQMSPAQAGQILNDPVALSDYEAAGGDINDLYDLADSVRYSRGRRAKDTVTPDMFGDAPVQQAPSDFTKERELLGLQRMSEEQKAERQQQIEQEREAQQERVLAKQQREDAEREETRGDIEYALRAQAPENAVYDLRYDPEDTNAPYKLVAQTHLGKPAEVIHKTKTLQDMSDYVYGNMDELTPYIPATPPAVDKVEPAETIKPTFAAKMVQDFTREVDAALEAGKINNLQRAELLKRMYRPNSYVKDTNGNLRPNDAIAKQEEAVRKAGERHRAENSEESAQALKESKDKLRTMVKNRVLNPARAALQTMIDARADEKTGAKVRIENAKLQQKLGEMEGTSTKEESAELRDAKIDLAEQKVQKYRKAEEQPAKSVTKRAIQKVVDQVTAKWKGPVNVKVVKSVGEIDNRRVRRAIQRDKAFDAKGVIAPDGTIYLIADNIESEADAKAVLFHEALGHLGLEKLFRNNLDAALVNMYRGNKQLKADVDQWRKDNKGAYAEDKNPLARAVEEVLAERSEQGQLNRTLLQKIAATVRNFARRMGMALQITDNDVAAILSMAHDKVVKGDAESAVKNVRYARSEEQTKFDEADDKLSAGADRVQRTNDTYGLNDGMVEATGATPVLREAALRAASLSPAARKVILKSMPTSGIMNWLKTKSPGLHKLAKTLQDTVRKSHGMKNSMIHAGDKLARKLETFVRKHGSSALANTRFQARINEVNPYEYETTAEHMAKSRAINEVRRRLENNTSKPKEMRAALTELENAVLAKRSNGEIRTKKGAVSILATNVERGREAIEQLAELTRRVRDTMEARAALDKQKGGRELYLAERAYHKDMFDARLALLDDKEAMERLAGKEGAQRISEMRAQLMRELQSPEQRAKQGDLFYNLDADLFDKDYFPLVREGEYWLRVLPDKGREEEFYTFPDAYELKKGQERVAKRLGVNATDSGAIRVGNDIKDLQDTFRGEDVMMQNVFAVVDKFTKTANPDLKELMDAVYQTWLLSTPERSARRRFLHAKEIAGFSSDVLLHYKQQVTTNANELTKLTYAGQIRAQAEELMNSANHPERPNNEQAELQDFARELMVRAEQEINPIPHNAFWNLVNRASYFYYLTSAATALTNFANIPMRVVPRFWREYGYRKGTAMWIKYMKLWKSLGRVKMEGTEHRFGDYLHAIMPSVNGSHFVKDNADLQWAMKQAMDRGILETTTDTIVQNERATPSKTRGKVATAVGDAAGNLSKVMSFLFTGTENISRQAAFYMSFELEMDKLKSTKPDMSKEDMRTAALDKALELTTDTVGDFSDWERSRLTKGEYARAFFLFKMHPILQTKYMVGAFHDVYKGIKPDATPAQRAEMRGALKEFTGVLMMTGLLGGITGLPFYSIMAYALAQSFDDDDDDDLRKLMQIDPAVAYDSDIMFRSWLMEKFGTAQRNDGDLADMLIHGPLGAMSDTEISSRITLDFPKLWFREPIAGDSLESTTMATILANVAGLSMGSQVLKSIDDFQAGDNRAAMTKLFPAFFRGWVNAAYMGKEGVTNRKGDTIIPKEDITAADQFRAVLGGRSLGLARLQDYYITRAKNEDNIQREKARILDRLEKGLREGEIKTQSDYQKFWKEEVIPFNRTYPNPYYIITPDTVERSMKSRAQGHARTVQGIRVNPKNAPQAAKSASPFLLK